MLAGEVDYTTIGPQFASVIEGQIASGKPFNLRKYFTNGYTFVGYNLANPENPLNGWDDLDEDAAVPMDPIWYRMDPIAGHAGCWDNTADDRC